MSFKFSESQNVEKQALVLPSKKKKLYQNEKKNPLTRSNQIKTFFFQ